MAADRGPHDSGGTSNPFLKTLVDLYDFLGFAVLASVSSSIVTLTAALLGARMWELGAPVYACAALPPVVIMPVAWWGLASLAVACASREEPSWRLLLGAVGRTYPRVLLYGVLGPAGAAVAMGTGALWLAIGTPSALGAEPSALSVALGALWAGAAFAWVCVWTLGWSFMALSGGRVGYSVRLAVAAVSAGPGITVLFAAHLAAVAGILLLPLAVSWQGLGIGLCVMFVVFIGPFYVALLSANVALYLAERLRALKERLEAEQNTPPVKKEGASDA